MARVSDPVIELVEADQVLRSEGTVWRYTIHTDQKTYRELPEVQAREVLENGGISQEGIQQALSMARAESNIDTTLLTCAECGHLHFRGIAFGWKICVIDGCSCKGQ